ncbi:MAG: HAAAP family serine/threonine permease [Legionellaceae bacterium]|nr:HAAAP family serine/threonine permease [Legionellaceae bacterium]
MSAVPPPAMAATAPSPVDSLRWNTQDTVWMLSLFGTAIGAGVLFLPINAGAGGLLPLLMISVLALPMTFCAHRGLTRFVLSGDNPQHDVTQVAQQHFGSTMGSLVAFCYFFAIFPILLMYSVAITNTCESFMVHQLEWNAPPRALLAALLLGGLWLIVTVGQAMVLRAMSLLVYPFILALLVLSLYLVPHWNLQFWTHNLLISTAELSPSATVVNAFWLLIPLMVFSFNHSPIISSFALDQRKRYGADADRKSGAILLYSHVLMIVMVLFFVFSCVFSLTPFDLARARAENISILSYLANHFQNPLIAYTAPGIAFIAITKSFLGHYLGAREGLQGLWHKVVPQQAGQRCRRPIVDGSMMSVCWLIATLNPSILGMIETLGGPIIAVILFLMPLYALYSVPSLQQYRHFPRDLLVAVIGLVTLGAKLTSLL